MKLKVCGMKYADNIAEVAKLSPDYMGFIFYSKSKRFVGDDFTMPEIPASIKKVGVFVNESIENIEEKINKYKLDYVQLHGDESPEFCERISKSVKVIKAFGVDESFDFISLNKYENSCEYFLFDTKAAAYGGSGTSFDKSVLKKYHLSVPFFVSGGIGMEEIQNLRYQISNLYAVDVNSKFETEPGLKDINKLKIFTAKVQRRGES